MHACMNETTTTTFNNNNNKMLNKHAPELTITRQQ